MSQTKLIAMDSGTLLTTPLPPTSFIASELVPQGLHILAGALKIGKSWLALHMCLRVALGESMWSFPVNSGTVLYLCLKDSFTRIQTRLFEITDEAPENLHFATMSEVIGEGLENQNEDFLNAHTDTNFVLKKDKRSGSSATLFCVGLDIEYRELQLEFDKATRIWCLVSDSITVDPQNSLFIFLMLWSPFSPSPERLRNWPARLRKCAEQSYVQTFLSRRCYAIKWNLLNAVSHSK